MEKFTKNEQDSIKKFKKKQKIMKKYVLNRMQALTQSQSQQ